MKLSYSKARTFLILAISVIIFANINGVFTQFLGISAPFSPLLLFLSILLLFISKVKKNDFNRAIRMLTIFMLSFLILGLISSMVNYPTYGLVFSDITYEYRKMLTSLLLVFVFYIYCIQLRNRSEFDDFIFYLGILFFIVQLGSIAESFLGLKNNFYLSATDLAGDRALGFFGNPNETGFQANLSLIFAYYLFLKKRINLFVLLFLVVCSFTAAIYSFSKLAILQSFIISLFFILYIVYRFLKLNRKVRLRALGLFIFGTLVTIFIVIPRLNNFYLGLEPAQRKRINDLATLVIEREVNEETTSSRTAVASEALALIAQKPLLGYGLKSFSVEKLTSHSYGVHNNYLKLMGEAGMIPFFLFFVFIFYMIYVAYFKAQIPDDFFIVAFIAAILILSMASHTLLSRKFITPLFGIIFAFTYFDSKKWLRV